MTPLRAYGLAALLLLGAMAPGVAHAQAAGAAAPSVRGAYFGLRGEPGKQKGMTGLLVTEVAPGSPAEAVGLQPGDLLHLLVRTDGPRDVYLKRPQVIARDQGAVEAWLETQAPDLEIQAWWFRAGRLVRKNVRLATPPGGAAAGVVQPGGPANLIEATRTAYLQMCGEGAERLSAATCGGMKRDLDAALAAEAAAAREAEVMAVHRQLCSPENRKLGEDTCAAMLAEARRKLAAGADTAPRRPAREPFDATPTPRSR